MTDEEKKFDYAPSPAAEEGDDADPWLTSVDDEGVGGAVLSGKARAAPSSAAARASGRATAWNPIEEVDSALLSGLIDARERKALYRLEQSMIEFMKDDARCAHDLSLYGSPPVYFLPSASFSHWRNPVFSHSPLPAAPTWRWEGRTTP